MALGKTDLAIGVRDGVTSMAEAITGFWFRARQPSSERQYTGSAGETAQ